MQLKRLNRPLQNTLKYIYIFSGLGRNNRIFCSWQLAFEGRDFCLKKMNQNNNLKLMSQSAVVCGRYRV